MKTIGFTEKYFTLWEVSDPKQVRLSQFEYREEQQYMYIQNLSMDLEKAKEKLKGKKFNIDLSLRGRKSFWVRGEVINDAPEDVFAFGKYVGRKINEVDDLEYVRWYWGEKHSEFTKNYLLENGYVWHNDKIMSKDYYEEAVRMESLNTYLDSLENGHHFQDGEKVSLEVKEVGFFSFEGQFGSTYVVTYGSKDGKLYKYMGANPCENKGGDDYFKIKATIKHSEYNGVLETKLIRIKLDL